MVVHCFRLIDVFGVAHRLQLSTRFKQLADALSFLSQYCLFFCNDILSPFVELDDGDAGHGAKQFLRGLHHAGDAGMERAAEDLACASSSRFASASERPLRYSVR